MEQLIAVTCPHCQTQQTISTPTIIDTTEMPIVRFEEIFSHRCDQCETRFQIRFPLLYHDPNLKLLINYEPTVEGGVMVNEALEEWSHQSMIDWESYHLRTVHEVQALVEKITLFEHDTNDRLIEMLKPLTDGLFEQQFPDQQIQQRYFIVEDGQKKFVYFTDQGSLTVDLHQQLIDFLHKNHAKAIRELPTGEWLTIDANDAYRILSNEK